MEKRLHKTDLGTITYWISYTSDIEAGVAAQKDSCADTAEELTFEPMRQPLSHRLALTKAYIGCVFPKHLGWSFYQG